MLEENIAGALGGIDADAVVGDNGTRCRSHPELLRREFDDSCEGGLLRYAQHFEGQFRIRCEGNFERHFGSHGRKCNLDYQKIPDVIETLKRYAFLGKKNKKNANMSWRVNFRRLEGRSRGSALLPRPFSFLGSLQNEWNEKNDWPRLYSFSTPEDFFSFFQRLFFPTYFFHNPFWAPIFGSAY